MTIVVYIIGLLLVLAGAIFVSMGLPYVRMEFGWSEVVSGTVAGSTGFVVLALAVVLSKLEEVRRTLSVLGVGPVLRSALSESPVDLAPAPAFEAPEHEEAQAVARPAMPAATPLVLPSAPIAPEPSSAAAPAAPRHPLFNMPPRADEPEPVTERDEPPTAPAEIEAAAPVTRDEPEPVDAAPATAYPAPPPPPPELTRSRPNFLAAFMARRNAALQASEPPARREEPGVEPPLVPIHEPIAPAAPGRTSVDLSSGWAEIEPAAPQPAPAEPVAAESAEEAHEPPPADAAAMPDTNPDEALHTAALHPPEPEAEASAQEPEPEATPPRPPPPVVVGRYNAGTASYVMYSNGMIEVETESGTHQFASMAELKAFIERRDAARV